MDDRPAFPEPEIRRLNLDSVVLRMIKWGVSPREFPFFHPPKAGLINRALKRLEVYGAVTPEGAITPDGTRMADLPVSIRSGRMLLEARDLSPRVVDSVLKAMAVIEAGGIVNKDFPGVTVHEGRYQSDLLNQIVIWNFQRQFRAYIHHKKLSLAKEILRELRSRLKVAPAGGDWSPEEESSVFRAILSGFTEWVFRRYGDYYSREEEEVRRLDRQSTLAADPPDWIAGQPFDLRVQSENPHTGEPEQIQLALITFASRISLELLETLSPFSYRHERVVRIRNHTAMIHHRIFFGDQLITEHTAAPEWSLPADRDAAMPQVLDWIRRQGDDLPLNRHRKRLEKDFAGLPRDMMAAKKAFKDYWEGFLQREIGARLRTDRLDLFFHFDHFNGRLQLDRLLPPVLVRSLRQSHWPGHTSMGGRNLAVEYTPSGPRVRLHVKDIEGIAPEEMYLSTGDALCLDLGDRQCPDWESAVAAYNQWKHAEIFHQRWRSRRRAARMADIVDLDFPIAFEGGKGKDNQALIYFTAPLFQNDEILLVHFPDEASAQRHMDALQSEWNSRQKDFRRRELEQVFRKKGWRVKS